MRNSLWNARTPPFLVIGLLVVALALPFWPRTGRAAKLLVLSTGATAPLSKPDGTGFLDLFIKNVFRRIGYEVRIDSLPPERALRNANEGIDDGDAHRMGGLSKFYPNLIQVPEPTLSMEFLAFGKHPELVTDGWKSLHSRTVGYIRGWKIVRQKLGGKSKLTPVIDQWALFRLLERNHADFVVYEAWQGLYVTHAMGLSDIRPAMPPLSVNHMYIYLNKRYKALVPKVAAAIKEAKEDGTFHKLYTSVLAPLMDKP